MTGDAFFDRLKAQLRAFGAIDWLIVVAGGLIGLAVADGLGLILGLIGGYLVVVGCRRCGAGDIAPRRDDPPPL